MKKRKLVSVIFTVLLIIIFSSYKNGPPPLTTCAPGETNCATTPLCHTSNANTGPGVVDISVMGEAIPVSYVPGKTYTIMPWVVDTAKRTFGFELVAKTKNAANAGSVTISNPVKTKVVTYGGLEYVMQTSAGASVFGIHDWMYDWTAPPKGSGRVVLYAAFVAGNNDGSVSGDNVYTDSLVLQETVGIDKLNDMNSMLSIFPLPAQQLLHVKLDERMRGSISITVLDIEGKRIAIKEVPQVYNHELQLHIADLNPGMYFLDIHDENAIHAAGKFIKVND